jgi:hypothetical protein
MSVTINNLISLITTTADRSSAGGSDGATIAEQVVGSNSIHEISGDFYVVLTSYKNTVPSGTLALTSHLEIWKSTDSGATWAQAGSNFSQSKAGGGLASAVIGSKIWISYTRTYFGGSSADKDVYLVAFDTSGNTWGSELSFDCTAGVQTEPGGSGATDYRPEGPYNMHVRPDSTLVLPITSSLGPSSIAVVVYDTIGAAWVRLKQLTVFQDAQAKLFCSSIMDPSGEIHVFYGYGYNPATFLHSALSYGSWTTSTHLLSGYSGVPLAWSDMGLEAGFLDPADSKFYLAAGVKTGAYPTIYGRPCIMYGDDGGWTLGSELDTGFDADYSVLCAAVVLCNGQLVYIWRGISSDGSTFRDRIGYAPHGSHDIPADWTWADGYNLGTPSPAVSGKTSPYKEAGYESSGQQDGPGTIGVVVSGGGDQVRIVSTMTDAVPILFPVYMYSIDVTSGGGAQTVLPSGIASAEALGTPGGSTGGVDVAPGGIPSDEAFGTPGGSTGPRDISPDGITSKERFGSAGVNGASGTRYSVY